MIHDLSEYDNLPSLGKVSVMGALMAQKAKRVGRVTDWDCSRQAKGYWSKKKAKNAKAKHRKKFKR
jgi:hypothetical protein